MHHIMKDKTRPRNIVSLHCTNFDLSFREMPIARLKILVVLCVCVIIRLYVLGLWDKYSRLYITSIMYKYIYLCVCLCVY